MVILLDLDGTLTNTADEKYKLFKDGIRETILADIPIFNGAEEFVSLLKRQGHYPVIVSDSHPKYVNLIASEIFNIPAVSLTDKPNNTKTLNFINSIPEYRFLFENRDNFLMIGDSWLDIELGRRLKIRTVYTKFYQATNIEDRDGIGQSWKPIKMGPTYIARNFSELHDIIINPNKNLLAIEAIFQNEDSNNMVKFKYQKSPAGFLAFRCLARQEDGECDRFARGDKYYQIDNPDRSPDFLQQLAAGASNYLKKVRSFPEYKWDLLTYVSDKKTTLPPNKMEEIFNLIESDVPKMKIFEWSDQFDGRLRDRINYKERREFISKYLNVIDGVALNEKSIIVIDDQFTSSATAYEICHQLRGKGAQNILFIALFYLILSVESKPCPKCNKPLKVKIKRIDGSKFFSCLPAKFGGEGCGYIENII